MTAADDLRTAVAALTEPTRRSVMLDPDTVVAGSPSKVTAEIPSLLEQLDDAAQQGAEGGGGRSVPGSRPPTGDDVLLVRIEIESGVLHYRHMLGLGLRDDLADAMTGLAEHVIAAVDDATSTIDEAQLARVAKLAATWRRDAQRVLRIDYQAREILGVACPACWTVWHAPNGPHEHSCRDDTCRGCTPREAALFILVGPSGGPRATQCRACGSVWWLGTAMDYLGRYTRAALDAGALAVKGRTA